MWVPAKLGLIFHGQAPQADIIIFVLLEEFDNIFGKTIQKNRNLLLTNFYNLAVFLPLMDNVQRVILASRLTNQEPAMIQGFVSFHPGRRTPRATKVFDVTIARLFGLSKVWQLLDKCKI